MASLPLTRHLTRGKDVMDLRYAEQISVADVAAEVGLSAAYFARSFTKAFGESPHRYLLSRRLERAAQLLRATDWSVARICHAVGLSSVGSFTTSFTRVFGCTPTAYRRAYPPTEADILVPHCMLRLYRRPRVRSFREDAAVDARRP